MNTKTLYFIKHIALLALFAAGLMLVPNVGTVSAQKGAVKEVATTEMLSYALNLKSVSDVAVYGGEGVTDKGNTTLARGFRQGGLEKESTNRRDSANIFSAMSQLPCTAVADTDLSDKHSRRASIVWRRHN